MVSADRVGAVYTIVELVLGCVVGACGVAVGCIVGSGVGNNFGTQGAAWIVWKWGALVWVTEGIGIGSEI